MMKSIRLTGVALLLAGTALTAPAWARETPPALAV